MFDDAEKLIFPYSRGRGADEKEETVFADPLAVWNALVKACDGDVYGWMEAIQPVKQLDPQGKPEPESAGQTTMRADAEERLIAAVRLAFDLLPYDRTTGTGATHSHAWAALNAYWSWTKGEESGDDSLPDGSASLAGQPVVP